MLRYQVVVDMMAKLHSGIEGLEYRQGDIRCADTTINAAVCWCLLWVRRACMP